MFNTVRSALFMFLLVIALPATAAKPYSSDGLVWNGNNFPSGSHFNLLIHGKKDDFNCPPADFDEFNNQVFGNVINVPRDPAAVISVLIESGAKGPKGKPDATELEVTDWCAVFPDDGEINNPYASFRLPKDSEGYMVFARVTGKPTKDDGSSTQIAISGCLEDVQDETGNSLMMLGLITTDGNSYVPECSSGFSTPTTLVRTEAIKGKKVKNAANITQLFEWTGVVYTLDGVSTTCGTEETPCDPATTSILCCYEDDLEETVGVYAGCTAPATNDTGGTYCPIVIDPFTYDVPVLVSSNTYDSDWVFNIGDFVDYLWDITNDGAYNVQIRFYPLSNQTWWDPRTDSIK
ncbi:MAG: hypothetical protein ACPF9K_15020 [Neptuniibacter sp.]